MNVYEFYNSLAINKYFRDNTIIEEKIFQCITTVNEILEKKINQKKFYYLLIK